jgi:alpha-beta hydrolase superfamily lysophospholipase
MIRRISFIALMLVPSLLGTFAPLQASDAKSPDSKVFYRTVKVDGLDIFYREAGPKDAPALLLLHGFPTSSHMFRNLIAALADEFHVVAPDYPGFGQSSARRQIQLHLR